MEAYLWTGFLVDLIKKIGVCVRQSQTGKGVSVCETESDGEGGLFVVYHFRSYCLLLLLLLSYYCSLALLYHSNFHIIL